MKPASRVKGHDAGHELTQAGTQALVLLAGVGLANVLDERGSANELHGEEDVAVFVGHELVQVHEVRVLYVGEEPELLLEPVDRGRADLQQRLQRDRALRSPVQHFVDRTHSAAAEQADHLEAHRALPGMRLRSWGAALLAYRQRRRLARPDLFGGHAGRQGRLALGAERRSFLLQAPHDPRPVHSPKIAW